MGFRGLYLGYKNQSIIAVWGNNRYLYSDPLKTQDVELLNVKPGGT